MVSVNPSLNLPVTGLRNAALSTAAPSPLATGAVPMGTAEQSLMAGDLLKTLKQLLGLEGQSPNLAAKFLAERGSFSVQPLEEAVKVRQADDSEYWAALGYTV